MAMNQAKTPVVRACEIVGSQAELARLLQVTPAMVNQLVKGARPVPLEHCLSIETATNGQVTRQEMRPDDFWRIWPDLSHMAPTDKAA
jgi:DNA-binding transcriptional regulator YdaS (Cro superfamily)